MKRLLLSLLLLTVSIAGFSDPVIYYIPFSAVVSGTTTYTASPTTLAANLTAAPAWTSTATLQGYNGCSGSSMSIAGAATGAVNTFSTTITVAPGYAMNITGMSFCTNHSTIGYPNWVLKANNVIFGSGSMGTGGNGTYSPILANSTNLTGTVTIDFVMSGGYNPAGTGRLSNFTLTGTVVSIGGVPPVVATSPVAATICAGASTTMSATFNNSPTSYVWQRSTTGTGGTYTDITSTTQDNAVGITYSNITSPTLGIATTGTSSAGANYAYRCVATNGAGSATTSTALLTVNPSPTIGLGANPNGCGGITNTPLTYTGTGGSPTQYSITWGAAAISAGFVNVVNATLPASPITLTLPGAAAANTYTATLTVSNGTCSSTPQPFSVTLGATTPPTANIAVNPTGGICAGTSVNLNATVTNGGTTPSYQWYVNNAPVGVNSNIYNYAPNNNDSVRCVVTSSNPCASGAAISNTIYMTVGTSVTPTINITVLPTGNLCAGTLTAFSANITNGGIVPTYHWYVNNVTAGTNNVDLVYVPNNGDQIKCTFTSSDFCATPPTVTSNTLTATVVPLIVPNIAISAPSSAVVGTPVTVYATVSNAGSGYVIIWMNHGVPFDTTSVPTAAGDTTHYIKGAGTDSITAKVFTSGGCYDTTTSTRVIVQPITPSGISSNYVNSYVVVYPNPAKDVLHVALITNATYRMMNVVGATMLEGTLTTGNNSIAVQALPAGMYLLEMTDTEGQRQTVRVVKE